MEIEGRHYKNQMFFYMYMQYMNVKRRYINSNNVFSDIF